MPDVILRILSIIGIILLILLSMVLLSLLLLLFWPVTYRIKGEKGHGKLWVTARADWLFGLFRVRYAYPVPGNMVVKLLWKTLIDTGQQEKGSEDDGESGRPTESGAPAGKAGEAENSAQTENTESGEKTVQTESTAPGEKAAETESGSKIPSPTAVAELPPAEPAAEDESASEDGAASDGQEQTENKGFSQVFQKIQKIKYTILKIYDKIKEIWANISYYAALLREDDTALLWGHVKLRIGKVLKNIRPRHIKANVLFGTGAPDTTGYVFGIYGMLLPVLGSKVCVTPDFNQAILEGDADISGHITLYTVAWNALKLLLDKKLQLFMKKMKAGRKENGR